MIHQFNRLRSEYGRAFAAILVASVLLPLAPFGGVTRAQAEPQTQSDLELVGTLEAPDEPALRSPAADAPTSAREVQFRPTVSATALADAKAAASSGGAKGATAAPVPQHPAAAFANVEGLNQSESGGSRPPDTHGAQGACRYVEVVNAAMRIFNTCVSPPSVIATKSLASFFGYTTQALFDPRVVYDKVWKRWVVTADAFSESATVQWFFFAASTTSDPNGSYRVYRTDQGGSGSAESFFDFPQLGMDQDALMFTGNVFPNAGGFAGARFICVAKAAIYNGGATSVPTWNGLDATLAPPIVLDNNAGAFLVAAANGTQLSLYRANNCGRTGTTLVKQAMISVPAYSAPPNAPQPGTSNLVDTSDRRFVNASTQSGSSLWNVHTIALGSFAAPKYYEINTATNAVKQSAFFFASGTSFDFNASIAASQNGTACVTWTAIDRPTGVNAQVRGSCRHNAAIGGIAADPLNTMNGPGVVIAGGTSSTFYDPTSGTVERWGDYSAVMMDDGNPNRAWVVNERITSSSVWGSRIGQIGY